MQHHGVYRHGRAIENLADIFKAIFVKPMITLPSLLARMEWNATSFKGVKSRQLG